MVGGAYGGFCDFDNHSGMFTYSSYRDPNLLKTVDVYDGGWPWLGVFLIFLFSPAQTGRAHAATSLAVFDVQARWTSWPTWR